MCLKHCWVSHPWLAIFCRFFLSQAIIYQLNSCGDAESPDPSGAPFKSYLSIRLLQFGLPFNNANFTALQPSVIS